MRLTVLFHTQDQLDVGTQPFVDELLNVKPLFLCQLAHEVVHVRLEIDRETEHGVGVLEPALGPVACNGG